MLVKLIMKTSRDKPTLDNLFESKKFDLPEECFWDDFQDKVKNRALSSITRPSFSQMLVKKTVILVPIILLSLYLVTPFFHNEKEVQSAVPMLDDLPNQVSATEFATKHIEVLQNLENTNYEVVMIDRGIDKPYHFEPSSFVEETLRLGDKDSYEIQYLSNAELNQDDAFARFTF